MFNMIRELPDNVVHGHGAVAAVVGHTTDWRAFGRPEAIRPRPQCGHAAAARRNIVAAAGDGSFFAATLLFVVVVAAVVVGGPVVDNNDLRNILLSLVVDADGLLQSHVVEAFAQPPSSHRPPDDLVLFGGVRQRFVLRDPHHGLGQTVDVGLPFNDEVRPRTLEPLLSFFGLRVHVVDELGHPLDVLLHPLQQHL